MKYVIQMMFIAISSLSSLISKADVHFTTQAQYADINGDQKADLIFQGNDNTFWISLAQSTGFSAPMAGMRHGGIYTQGQAQYADINGDGMADLIFQGACPVADAQAGINNCFYVSLSNGRSFSPPGIWVKHGGSFISGQAQYADINGDKKADLIFQGIDNRFWVSISSGSSFSPPQLWGTHKGMFKYGQAQFADVNGDQRVDLIFQDPCAREYKLLGIDNCFDVSLSSGSFFYSPKQWMRHGGSFVAGQAQYKDINGDGKADLIVQTQDNGFWVSFSNGNEFGMSALLIKHGGLFKYGQAQFADVNGDQRADLIFQGSCAAADAQNGINNCFYVSLSRGNDFYPIQLWNKHGGEFAVGQAQLVDMNGDKKSDLIFQGNNNEFWSSVSFGSQFNSPVRAVVHGGQFLARQTPPPWQYGQLRQCLARSSSRAIPIGKQTWFGNDWSACQMHFAAVVVVPPESGFGSGTVILPTGDVLPTEGSPTSGLQEAVNYAADYGWDIFVYGKSRFSARGRYQLNVPLRFPPLQGKTIRLMNVSLEFGPLVTDAALLIESSMMVDFKLTGRIYAPHAASGVRFAPRSLVPLDGFVYGISGITDSRFEVQSIDAQQFGFHFDPTEKATISGSSFGLFEVNGSAGKNFTACRDCMFDRPDTLTGMNVQSEGETLDVLQPQGVVVLPPLGPLGNKGTVVLPDGQLLDVSHSSTAGLQEAVNFAFQNNLDIAVYGRGLQNSKIVRVGPNEAAYPTDGFYHLNQNLVIPQSYGRTMKIYNATLNYAPSLVGAALQIHQAVAMNFEFTGQIVAYGSNQSGVLISSSQGEVRDSSFKLGSILAKQIVFELETYQFPIRNNFFFVRELLEGNTGIMLRSVYGQVIQSNYIRCPHLHGYKIGGVDFQDPINSASTVLLNRFDLFLQRDAYQPQFDVGVGGRGNTVYLNPVKNLFSHQGADNTILYSH